MRRLRHILVAVALAGATSALLIPAAPAQGQPPSQPQPYLAIDHDFPDPSLLRAGERYYAYSTNADGRNMPVASAEGLYGTWTIAADGLPTLGSWASEGFTWAPDVTVLDDGSYLVYYTARHTASGRQCIGAARSTSPGGPFEPVGDSALICPTEEGGAIDAATFVDADGDRYITYKNDGNAIGQPTYLYLQRVAANGTTLIGEPVRTMQNDPNVEGGLIEAPFLVRHQSRYYMFYSYGQWWNETYTTAYAVASSLAGPWTKATEPLMTTRSLKGSAIGPGGASFLTEGRQGEVVVFHGVRNTPSFHRAMYVARLKWNGATPVVSVTK
ncbi:glycoside hydrolase family 43 protein [Actinopolymorpha singaporensis]|uniref:Glycosyl hydrolases family 43 n=1 Tax=Actinopolymorpha singaporensis TaxID=117157 RepID=A0A1H1UMZ8_9ACTN|nr:glycoside hydrolase family 43 protein [Actinopolymorpha singaporensis]SDS73887.1 Glycosyl hydrolases family 43 [Actinopolymorpha singaporensis]